MREAAGPLGMSEGVRFTRRDDWHDRFANSHFEHRTNINHPADQARASYSLHASAIDVAQALRTFMRRGGGLSESGYEAMFTEHVDTRSAATETDWPAHHGLGPRIVHTPFGRLIGHSGAGTGWIAHMEFYEDHQAGYAVVFNGENARYLGPALRRFLVAGQAYTVLESDVD